LLLVVPEEDSELTGSEAVSRLFDAPEVSDFVVCPLGL